MEICKASKIDKLSKKEITKQNNQLFYNNVNLLDLVEKYHTPLRVTFLDVIKDHVIDLKNAFSKAIEENNYHGKFIYCNANKANYEFLELKEAYINGDGIECSSYYDLLLTKDLVNLTDDAFVKPIVCNGIKGDDYLDEIVDLTNKGYNIIDICDNLNEYLALKKKATKAVNIGLRIHLPSLYIESGNDCITDDRFGMMDDEFNTIINDLKSTTNLYLSTIHFHQRGFDFEKDKFYENIEKVFKYYVKAKRNINSVCNFDMGGGTPLPVDYSFDYNKWASELLQEIKRLSVVYQVEEPNIISENGKYSQKDSTINIYEVKYVKNTCNIPWYVCDGSLLIAMPEMYALGEEILVLPINQLDKELVKTRLSSITCDCDDVLYDKAKGYMLLPKIEKDEKLYIGLFGTGSYQNSMNGKGGWHHCLLPQEKDVIVYTKDFKKIDVIRDELQNIEAIKDLVHFNKNYK